MSDKLPMQKVTRTMIGVHVDVLLASKLKRLASEKEQTISDYCGGILEEATAREEYTVEDENAAHEMTLKNIQKRDEQKRKKGIK